MRQSAHSLHFARRFLPAAWILLLALITTGSSPLPRKEKVDDAAFIFYKANPATQDIRLYWKDGNGSIYRSISNLGQSLIKEKKKLIFAMNAGMYQEDRSPLGLYIENGKTLKRLNTANATGNFYLKPNGVFYLTKDRKAGICKTEDFRDNGMMAYATQSGPMLLIDGKTHPAFTQGSINVNIRNGVGLLPDGSLLFAMSKDAVNFHDFADFFKRQGCKYALYLDGFVSRTYIPEKDWIQTGGNFGVMIGETTDID